MENMVNFQQLGNTYKGKKVFLTGHTGFKGAWMLKTLSLLGAEIKGYALEPQTPNDLFHLIEGDKLCESVIADLRDKKRLESEIVAFQPDFIFHLAAQPLVRLSYEIPAETFEDYDNHLKGIAVARAGNVIGGGDWSKDRLIPDIVRSLMANRPVVIRNPNAVRPWQHVLEPVIGYLSLGMHLENDPIEFTQAYNFGPQSEDALSVEEMVKAAIDSWGTGEYQIEQEANQPHEAGLLKLDISKVKSDLNWAPKMNAKETVKFTLDWYNIFVIRLM